MEKKYTLNEIARIHLALNKDWNTRVKDIKLNVKALYHLISIKRRLAEEFQKAQDAVQTIMLTNNLESDDNGSFKAKDDEQAAEINRQITELGDQEVCLKFDCIKLSNEDILPADILELLFDFIYFEEEAENG